MDDRCGEPVAVNSYSLVAYLPDPLAGFIEQLRCELVPGCALRAHVSVLPPRPLACSANVALGQIRKALCDFQPFEIEFGEVRFFPKTNVVYLSIRRGLAELEELHQALNCGPAGYFETYPYQPHLTLAQQIDPGAMAPAGELVSRRWQEFPHPRRFMADTLTFVQSTSNNQWRDLAEIPLGVPVGV